ncbi:GDP-mannose 4,6-dehydratase [Candidatus Woesearchaeota archaeon]|nr:GDP-mannose 4,6-dehydratase [Candidatus Woesearchaeota archaeon]
MKVLVTGGAGFIGSNLCDSLVKENKVICIDNFNDYYNPKIKEANIQSLLKNPNFKVYRTDILNYSEMDSIFSKEKPEKVVHLAARTGVRPSVINPKIYEDVNVGGTLIMLELARKYGIKKLVFSSSSSVYGANEKIPFSEEDETSRQINPYGKTKKTGEVLCRYYNLMHKMQIVCLRFFTVYGPRGRPDMAVHKFTRLISDDKEIEVFGNGKSKRDYTYVEDIVKGIVSALNKDLNFEIINLGDNNPVELNHLIELIEKGLDKKAKIRHIPEQKGDMDVTFADIDKAKRLLGYKPKVKIEEGIRLFVDWFKRKDL